MLFLKDETTTDLALIIEKAKAINVADVCRQLFVIRNVIKNNIIKNLWFGVFERSGQSDAMHICAPADERDKISEINRYFCGMTHQGGVVHVPGSDDVATVLRNESMVMLFLLQQYPDLVRDLRAKNSAVTQADDAKVIRQCAAYKNRKFKKHNISHTADGIYVSKDTVWSTRERSYYNCHGVLVFDDGILLVDMRSSGIRHPVCSFVSQRNQIMPGATSLISDHVQTVNDDFKEKLEAKLSRLTIDNVYNMSPYNDTLTEVFGAADAMVPLGDTYAACTMSVRNNYRVVSQSNISLDTTEKSSVPIWSLLKPSSYRVGLAEGITVLANNFPYKKLTASAVGRSYRVDSSISRLIMSKAEYDRLAKASKNGLANFVKRDMTFVSPPKVPNRKTGLRFLSCHNIVDKDGNTVLPGSFQSVFGHELDNNIQEFVDLVKASNPNVILTQAIFTASMSNYEIDKIKNAMQKLAKLSKDTPVVAVYGYKSYVKSKSAGYFTDYKSTVLEQLKAECDFDLFCRIVWLSVGDTIHRLEHASYPSKQLNEVIARIRKLAELQNLLKDVPQIAYAFSRHAAALNIDLGCDQDVLDRLNKMEITPEQVQLYMAAIHARVLDPKDAGLNFCLSDNEMRRLRNFVHGESECSYTFQLCCDVINAMDPNQRHVSKNVLPEKITL